MKETLEHATKAQAIPEPTTTVKVSDKDGLEVWVVGEGTPVVLVHGALLGSLLKPVAEALADQGEYRAIWYRRRGYNGKPTGPAPVPEQARDVVKILDALEVPLAFLLVSGPPPFRETQELLKQWQPNLTVLEISTDHHFFPVTATAETAEVIDNWIRSQYTTN